MSYEPDDYDTHCPTCDALEPTHRTTCAMRCQATLTWKPIDGETGRVEADQSEFCYLTSGHTGWHRSYEGHFGPLAKSPDPTPVSRS